MEREGSETLMQDHSCLQGREGSHMMKSLAPLWQKKKSLASQTTSIKVIGQGGLVLCDVFSLASVVVRSWLDTDTRFGIWSFIRYTNGLNTITCACMVTDSTQHLC